MPIVQDEEISRLLTEGKLKAITVDTNIFDEKGLQLNSPALQAISGLQHKPFPFILSDTVAKEVRSHLVKETEDAARVVRRAIGKAVGAFETFAPTRDDLLAQITGGRTPAVAAQERFDAFLLRSGCEVIDDTALVNTATLFNGYFAGSPPFGTGIKKNEFPDALALNALEATAATRSIAILVVSKDKDWAAFCEASEHLYLVPEIERALALINNANALLRTAIVSWLDTEGEGHQEVRDNIEYNVGQISYSANGNSTSGEMEAIAWDGELQSIDWPDEADVDIIEINAEDDGSVLEVTVSLPMTLFVKVPVEVSFSVWDSVDRESLSMGGREIEVEEEIDARATVTLRLFGLGSKDETIDFIESEIDIKYVDVELGDVDVFQPEDYWDEEEHP